MADFEIYTDDAPGQEPRHRPNKKLTQGLTQRSALGNVTNRTRVQPSRAAKLGHSEKIGGKPPLSALEAHGESSAPDKPKARRDIRKKDSGEAGFHKTQKLSGPPGPSHSLKAANAEDKNGGGQWAVAYHPDDHFHSAQYQEDIYEYLLQAEQRLRACPGYLLKQPDITGEMRSILIDWLVEVAAEYKLQEETFFLAVGYIDRFLSVMSVNRDKLQLVGTSAMFIAAKYEEIYPPDVNDFVYVTDHSYTVARLLKMEQIMLKALCFDVSMPTAHWFAQRLLAPLAEVGNGKRDCPAASSTSLCHGGQQAKGLTILSNLVFYLLELALVDSSGGECHGCAFIQERPSVLASAAVLYGRMVLQYEPTWSAHMERVSTYSSSALAHCARALGLLHRSAPELAQQSVQTKYCQPKYGGVARIPAVSVHMTSSGIELME